MLIASRSLVLAGILSFSSVLPAGTRTIDGDPSDWTGTGPVQIHDVAISNDEFIYKGESGDVRTDPAGGLGNYDLTELRMTRDDTYLYILARFADITDTDSVSICFGFDNDRSAGDVNGLSFCGDESGVTYASADQQPEYVVSVHNSTDPETEVEFFHDAGAGFWYNTDQSGNTAWISVANDVVEVRLLLSHLGMTTASTFGFSAVTFDNGTTADPGAKDFNNSTDTTVDYPTNDGLDGMGGVPGVSQNAFQRLFNSTVNLQSAAIAEIQLPTLAGVDDWSLLAE
ncbi:hypothetical protein GC173_17535 [bacterium]|nr:hypothetical protein [bacterium]